MKNEPRKLFVHNQGRLKENIYYFDFENLIFLNLTESDQSCQILVYLRTQRSRKMGKAQPSQSKSLQKLACLCLHIWRYANLILACIIHPPARAIILTFNKLSFRCAACSLILPLATL